MTINALKVEIDYLEQMQTGIDVFNNRRHKHNGCLSVDISVEGEEYESVFLERPFSEELLVFMDGLMKRVQEDVVQRVAKLGVTD